MTVVVLNYNGMRFLDECLSSLANQTYRDFEVVVVDNGSTDGSAQYLAQRYSGECRLLFNERNLGFATGNNRALALARGELIVFLNNDTRTDPHWLRELVTAADRYPEAGSLASQIRSYQRPDVLDTAGIIIYRDGMSRGLGRMQPAAVFCEQREVFAPSGCAALYRRRVLDEIGGFDDDFFAYCEDMDLGMRARLAGWTSRYIPTARVYHHYSGTTGSYSPQKAFLVERNHLWLLVKLFPLRLILLSPWYSLVRYLLQAYGVVTKRGAAGKFAAQSPAYLLVVILIRAYLETMWRLPELLRKRRRARRHVRVSRLEIMSWFDRFGISAKELALGD